MLVVMIHRCSRWVGLLAASFPWKQGTIVSEGTMKLVEGSLLSSLSRQENQSLQNVIFSCLGDTRIKTISSKSCSFCGNLGLHWMDSCIGLLLVLRTESSRKRALFKVRCTERQRKLHPPPVCEQGKLSCI